MSSYTHGNYIVYEHAGFSTAYRIWGESLVSCHSVCFDLRLYQVGLVAYIISSIFRLLYIYRHGNYIVYEHTGLSTAYRIWGESLISCHPVCFHLRLYQVLNAVEYARYVYVKKKMYVC